ncbi:MAG: hypothetical protein RLZZ436_3157 [Planctomycetota bacterium]
MAQIYDTLLHQSKTKVMAYLMMCLGLVELALSSKRCSDWDYTKKEGTKSCWDKPGAGVGETELNPPRKEPSS